MAKEIVSDMETRVGLNMSEAVKSISQLTTAVKVSTSAWKAQESLFKSSGDYLSAAKAKYDGLGESIERQQQKIKQLQTDQSAINRDTKEGADAYDKLQIQIDRATTKLSSMSAQQERAKNSLETQKSGVLGLSNELKNLTQVSNSYVERLKAEGNEAEAQKAKLSGLKEASSKLSELYDKQVSQLEKLKGAQNQDSDAISRQTVRVNEAATKMAEAKRQTAELSAELSKKPQSWLGRIRTNVSAYRGETEKATKSTSRLGDVIKGSFIGGLAVSGFQAITSKIHEAIQAGAEFNKEQDTMKTVWHSLTTEAPRDGSELIKYINKLGQSTIYSTDTINKMAQSFYHVHSNVDETKRWTDSFVALGSTLHMTNDALSESGEQFAKIVAGGKASQEDLNVMINRFPMFGEAIQKATGKSMAQLQAMSAKGQLTATQFEQALDYLGKKYKSGTTEAMTSFQGMSMYLSSRGSKLFGDIEKSSFNMSKSVKTDLLNLTSDKSMETYAKAISSGIGTAMSGLTKVLDYVSAHKTDLLGVVSSLAKITKLLFDGAWKAVSGTINGIGNAFSSMTGNAKKSSDPVKNLNRLLSGLAKHQNAIKGIGAALVGAFAAAKLMSGINSLAKGIGSVSAALHGASDAQAAAAYTQKALNVAMKANIFIAVATAIVGIGIALVELYKHNAKFRKFVNGIAEAAHKAFDGMVKYAKVAFSAIGEFFTGKLGWEKAIGNEVGKVGKAISSGFTTTINWIKKNWGGLALLLVNPFAGAIKLLYNNNKGFKKWADDLVKGVVNVFKKLSKDLNTIWNGIKKVAGIVWKGIEIAALAPIVILAAEMVVVWKRIQKPVEAIWNGMKRTAQIVWKGISDVIIQPMVNGYKTLSSIVGRMASFVGQMWNAVWRDTVNRWTAIGRAISKPAQDAFNFVAKTWNSLSKWTSNTWNDIAHFTSNIWNGIWRTVSNFASNLWHDVAKIFNRLGSDVVGIWNNIKKWTSDAWNAVVVFVSKPVDAVWNKVTSVFGKMSSWIGDTLGTIKSVWHNTWSDVGSFFGGIWDGIQKAGKSGINGVIDFLNGGINGIDSVISFLGGKKKAISDIPKLAVGTMNGRLVKDTLAVLNDGHDSPETGNKEMVIKQNGQMGIVQGKNRLTYLEAGDAVVNAHDTRDIMYGMGIPHFATGSGWFDNIKGAISWVGGKFDDVGKWIGDKTKAIENFMKHPIDEVIKVFDKFTSGFKDTSELIADMASPAGHFVIKQGEKWFKDLFSGLNDDQGDAGGGKGAPSGAGVQRWRDQVKQALDANHLSTSDSMIERILRQITTESGGNEKASQHGDPDGDGSGPAMGLMQTKRNTFNHYAFAGHKDIWNGYDSLLAGLAYAKARYGSSLSFLGNGHGYANGGFVSTNQMIEVAERNRPEVIIPLDPSLKPRANQLIEQTNKIVNPESRSNNADLTRMEQIAERIENTLNVLVGFGYQQQNQPQPRSANLFDTLVGTMQQKGQILNNQNLN